MGRNRDRNDDDEKPTGLNNSRWPSGPYFPEDKAEFHHASKEAQEWFLRLDEEDVSRLTYSVKLASWVRMGLKWARWAFLAFTGGLAAAVAAGENLSKLPMTIANALSVLRGLFP